MTENCLMLHFALELYLSTRKLKVGEPGNLATEIRRTAVNLSTSINFLMYNNHYCDKDIYKTLSALCVLETYFLIALRKKWIKDIKNIDVKIRAIKLLINSKLENQEVCI